MTTDVVTDAKTGYLLYLAGHIYWAIATWILMFLPALLSFAMQKSCLKSLDKILGHLPLGQVWYHFKVIRKLKQLREEMMEQIDFYKKLNYDNLPPGIKEDLKCRSEKYHEDLDKYKAIMSDLQTQKARPCSFTLFL